MSETGNQQTWDKERQLRSEVSAAATRETELKDTVAELSSKVNSLQSEKDKLDDDSSMEDIVGRINEVQTQLTEANRSMGESKTTVQALRGELEQTQTQLKQSRTEQHRVQTKAEREAAGKSVTDKLLDKMDGKYDPKFRNEAFKAAEKRFNESPMSKTVEGDNTKFIVEDDVRIAAINTMVEDEYRTLSEADTNKAVSDNTNSGTAATITAPAAAPGTGGSAHSDIPEVPEGLSREETVDAMLKRNRAIADAQT